MDLRGRSLLKEIDLSAGEFLYLVDLGGRLRADKRAGRRAPAGRPEHRADLREDLHAHPLGLRGGHA